jgi:ADP-ribose pyrophosphatase
MSPWKRLSLEEILSEPVRLVRERLKTHTGKEITYIYRPGPVAASFVLPVTQEATALLIRQYRHPTGKFLLEVPAGKVDAGENPLEAARRVGRPALEDGELLETLEIPLKELYALLERGEVLDASTALTLFYARPHLRERGLL